MRESRGGRRAGGGRGGGGSVEVFNLPKPQKCKTPQGLGSIFNSGKSSTGTPASSSPPSSSAPLPPPPPPPLLHGPPSAFSRSLALTQPDTPWGSGTQLSLCPALHLPLGTHSRENVDLGKKKKRCTLVESNRKLGLGGDLLKRDVFFRLYLACVSLELGSKFGPAKAIF